MSEQLQEAIKNFDAKEGNEQLRESLREEVRNAVQNTINDKEEQVDESVNRLIESELKNYDFEQVNESIKGKLSQLGITVSGMLSGFGIAALGALSLIGAPVTGGASIVGGLGLFLGSGAIGKKVRNILDLRQFEKLEKEITETMKARDNLLKKGVDEGDPDKFKTEVKQITNKMKSLGKKMRKEVSQSEEAIKSKLTRKEFTRLEDTVEAAEKGRLTTIQDLASQSIA